MIGNENVGKTSLKERLCGSNSEEENRKAYEKLQKEKKEEDMTHGVEIVRFCFFFFFKKLIILFRWSNEKNKTLFSIWDFAGHEGFFFKKLKYLYYYYNVFFFSQSTTLHTPFSLVASAFIFYFLIVLFHWNK